MEVADGIWQSRRNTSDRVIDEGCFAARERAQLESRSNLALAKSSGFEPDPCLWVIIPPRCSHRLDSPPMNDPTRKPSACSISPVDPARWFVDEAFSQNSALQSYLRTTYPKLRDVDDVIQESYLRLWKVRATQPIRSVKAFLFTVARRLAIDVHRRNKRSPVELVGDLATLPVIEERRSIADTAGVQEKVALLVEALAALPPRCREILILRKLDGMSQREVALRLGLSERTIEEQVARGMKRCETYLRLRGITEYRSR